MNKIAILGSGSVGETLANGFLKHGHAVMRGSRDTKKLEQWKTGAKGDASIGSYADAAKWADTVVIAVKGAIAEGLVAELAQLLANKTVIDVTIPIGDKPPVNGVLSYFTTLDGSLMERLQKKAPNAHFVKAFNSVGAAFMVNPKFPTTPTMFIAGNDAGAKKEVTDILAKFGWEAADMGGVEGARAIEPLCMLWCIPGMLRNEWAHAFKLLKPA
jgi:predicted dinucleotide-binding enzyme